MVVVPINGCAHEMGEEFCELHNDPLLDDYMFMESRPRDIGGDTIMGAALDVETGLPFDVSLASTIEQRRPRCVHCKAICRVFLSEAQLTEHVEREQARIAATPSTDDALVREIFR